MDKTTHKERFAMSFAAYDLLYKLDVVWTLLSDLYTEIYGVREPSVGGYEINHTAATLLAAEDVLYGCMAELNHLCGSTDYRGSESRLEDAKRLLDMHKAEELHSKLSDKVRLARNPATAAALKAEIDKISPLDDAEAIPLLEALLAQ